MSIQPSFWRSLGKTDDAFLTVTNRAFNTNLPSAVSAQTWLTSMGYYTNFIPVPPINYGLLYNWYTTSDIRELLSTGWHVPSQSDVSTLSSYSSSDSGKLRESGTTHWQAPNTATNETNFSFVGGGYRWYGNGSIFAFILSSGYFWSSTLFDASNLIAFSMYNSISTIQSNVSNKKNGYSIRIIKDSTSLSNGQTGSYTGNDGKIYPTICIGTQEWLSCNLAETKYRNGDSIPEVTDNTAWGNLTTGAWCYYDNNSSYM